MILSGDFLRRCLQINQVFLYHLIYLGGFPDPLQRNNTMGFISRTNGHSNGLQSIIIRRPESPLTAPK